MLLMFASITVKFIDINKHNDNNNKSYHNNNCMIKLTFIKADV